MKQIPWDVSKGGAINSIFENSIKIYEILKDVCIPYTYICSLDKVDDN